MQRFYCDKCGKEITDFNDYLNTTVHTPTTGILVGDLCKKCYDNLLNLINNFTKGDTNNA